MEKDEGGVEAGGEQFVPLKGETWTPETRTVRMAWVKVDGTEGGGGPGVAPKGAEKPAPRLRGGSPDWSVLGAVGTGWLGGRRCVSLVASGRGGCVTEMMSPQAARHLADRLESAARQVEADNAADGGDPVGGAR